MKEKIFGEIKPWKPPKYEENTYTNICYVGGGTRGRNFYKNVKILINKDILEYFEKCEKQNYFKFWSYSHIKKINILKKRYGKNR
jgi:hypothetical protein